MKTVITQDEFEEFSAIAEFIFEHTEPCENLTEFREIHAQFVRDRVTAATEVSDYDLHRYNFLCGSYGYSLRNASPERGDRFLLLHELLMAERPLYREFDDPEERTAADFLDEARKIVANQRRHED